MEFIIIVGMIIVFFAVFMLVILGNFSDLNKKKESLRLKELAVQVQTEINLASKSSEGYYREFRIPLNLEGKDYEINITDSGVYVRTPRNALSLHTEEVQGDLKKGVNTIKKINGIVYVNQ